MTERQLQNRVWLVVAALVSVFVIAVVSKFALNKDDVYASIKDFSPLFLAIGGAYLAFCLQRRQAFISSLKELWKEMVISHIAILRYIDTENNIEDYNRTFEQISKTVDLVRSVYPNVGENDMNVGLYPFQPLRDMLHALKRLHPNDPQSFAADEREKVEVAWDALRRSFLPEFSRPPATKPIVEYAATDPRRAAGQKKARR